MPDPIDLEVPAAITDELQADAMAPPDAVKRMTHEVDADDMFGLTA